MTIITARPFFRPDSEELRYLPECPRQLRNTNLLGWIAIQHGSDRKDGSFNTLNLNTLENTNYPLPGRPGFFVETNQPGVVLIGLEKRLALYNWQTLTLTETGIEIDSPARVIINDGTAVPGGVIFGTKDTRFADPIAKLYYFDTELGHLFTLQDGMICSNGKFLDSHGVLVDIDSPRKMIEARKVNWTEGVVTESRILSDFRHLDAVPDGMKIAPNPQSAVAAFYNPNPAEYGVAYQVSLQSGDVETEFRIPGSPRVTCPEFVQLDGQIKLLLTTAVEGMPDDRRRAAPEAGTMFIADTEYTALPPYPPLVPVAAFLLGE